MSGKASAAGLADRPAPVATCHSAHSVLERCQAPVFPEILPPGESIHVHFPPSPPVVDEYRRRGSRDPVPRSSFGRRGSAAGADSGNEGHQPAARTVSRLADVGTLPQRAVAAGLFGRPRGPRLPVRPRRVDAVARRAARPGLGRKS